MRWLWFLVFLLLAFHSPVAGAGDEVHASPDITVELNGALVDDEGVAIDDFVGGVAIQDLGSLPQGASVNAYHLESNGDSLFVLDVTSELPGAVTAEPIDVIRYDGVTYAPVFDGSARGITSGVGIDALSLIEATGDLLLSFDTTVGLGGSVVADDEDLVLFDGAIFSLFFDGSSEGVDTALDLDAVHYREGTNELVLSFDGSGTLGGIIFDDEDAIVFTPLLSSWSMLYDGSAEHVEWIPSDLDAVYVPEPSVFLMLPTGVAFLALIGRRRIRQDSCIREG